MAETKTSCSAYHLKQNNIAILTDWSGIQDFITDMSGMTKSWKDGHCLTCVNLIFVSEELNLQLAFTC